MGNGSLLQSSCRRSQPQQNQARSSVLQSREFKIDATVAKTSLKIASSSFLIYFAIISVCLTFERSRNYPKSEFRGAVSTLEKNIQIFAPECSRSL